MTDKPTGGLAFPQTITATPDGGIIMSDQYEGSSGITVRDYAAIKFMAAMLGLQDDRGTHMAPPPASAAKQAFDYADAFIEARGE